MIKRLLIALLIAALLSTLMSFIGALILWEVYGVIATAFNLPTLSYWVFYGILFVISLFSVKINSKTE